MTNLDRIKNMTLDEMTAAKKSHLRQRASSLSSRTATVMSVMKTHSAMFAKTAPEH